MIESPSRLTLAFIDLRAECTRYARSTCTARLKIIASDLDFSGRAASRKGIYRILNRTIPQTVGRYPRPAVDAAVPYTRGHVRLSRPPLFDLCGARYRHMETIPTRRSGAIGYAPPTRHTPVNFYRNTFRREMGKFPFAAKRRGVSTRYYARGRNKVLHGRSFLFSAGPCRGARAADGSSVGCRRRRRSCLPGPLI